LKTPETPEKLLQPESLTVQIYNIYYHKAIVSKDLEFVAKRKTNNISQGQLWDLSVKFSYIQRLHKLVYSETDSSHQRT
jgi:hypothetical protein